MTGRLVTVVVGLTAIATSFAETPRFPKTREEVIALRQDVWAEAAIRQPGGPSYEFFRDLFPPLRYVNTAFKHYPIVLSGPGSGVKARYVSNGSAINPKADQKPMWYDPAFGVEFFVGEKREVYGADPDRLDGPRYTEGWLPIVKMTYTVGQTKFDQEAFVAAMGGWANYGAVYVNFRPSAGNGRIVVRIRATGELKHTPGMVTSADGEGLVGHDSTWKWKAEEDELFADVTNGNDATLIVLTRPMSNAKLTAAPSFHLYERDRTEQLWGARLTPGVNLEVPEPIVQNAWRACLVGNLMTAVGDRMHYSAGNAYDHLYEAECGDATRALMLMGQTADARRFVGPLLTFNRQVTRFHVAGHKLQLLAHYYLVTRDAAYMKEKEAVWSPVIDFIINSRKTQNGLLPKDRYAGDIDKGVYSLSSNAACWRGLRDMAVVLADLGQGERAAKLTNEVKEYKSAILDAVAKSERKETKPPFIPIPLLSDDAPFSPLTATRLGSYYDLMIPYVLGSDIFAGTEREGWIVDYLRQHGGLAMGMIRSQGHQGPLGHEPGNNVLYGLRYMHTILRRDDRDHALAGFYGHLAQAMTRDTFIGGEGSKFFHGDAKGRLFYLPPNTAANGMFLQTLRYLLVQDWTDDLGKPHELRLLYGAPGRWFEDGKALKFERAPTLFGPLSMRCESRLSKGEVVVELEAPPRPPGKWTLRPPLPPGWRFVSATVGDAAATMGPGGVVSLTGKTGSLRVRYVVEKSGS
jgi:hypothetical protein